jgi:methyl-accepting chemotaxis protein
MARTGGLGSAFDNRSLRTKIGSAVLVATAMGVIIAVLSLRTLYQMSDTSIAAQRHDLSVLKASSTVGQNLEAYVGSVTAMTAYPMVAAEIAKGMATQQETIDAGLKTLAASLTDPTGAAVVAKMNTDWSAFKAFLTGAPPVATPEAMAAGLAQFNELHSELATDQAAVEQYVSDRVSTQIAAAEKRKSSAVRTMVILLVVGVVISLYLGMRVASRVRRAVAGVSLAAEGLAEGDLTRSCEVTDRDEVGRMAAALDRGISRLREDVVQLVPATPPPCRIPPTS